MSLSITVDTGFDEILKCDQDGGKLNFDHEVGKFKELSDGEVKKLSKSGKASYYVSKGMNAQAAKVKEAPPTAGLKITGRYASATSRLEVIYPEGWREKYHPCWKRGDEFESCKRAGYVPVGRDGEDAGVESFGAGGTGAGGSLHTVGTSHETEMVLMKEPVEQNDERVGVPAKQSTARRDNLEESTKEAIIAAGGRPYVPPKGATSDGKNWGPPK